MDQAPTTSPKPTWTQRGIVLRFRRKSQTVDFAFSGVDGFVRHRTGRHAALLAHYGFLSVFPLLVVATTILGFVLESNPDLRDDIVDSAFSNIPFIGEQIKNDPSSLRGNTLVLIFGLATTLWAGTRAFAVAQTAMNDIWEIPDFDRPNLAKTRLRALVAILVVGVAQIASGTVSGLIGVSGVGWLVRALLAVITVAINIAALTMSFRVLTARRLGRRQLLPGAIGAGVGFSLLQVIGGALVIRATRQASPVYGSFATVIALLSWLSLHSGLALLGVEANAALDRRRTVSSS